VQEEKKREEEKKSKKRAKPNMPVINEEAERALYEPFGAVEHSGMLLRFTSETLLDQDNYTQRESHEEQKKKLQELQVKLQEQAEGPSMHLVSSDYSVEEVLDKKALTELRKQQKIDLALPKVRPEVARKVMQLNFNHQLEKETGFIYIFRNATKVMLPQESQEPGSDESTQNSWKGRLRDRNAYKMPLLPHDRFLYVNGEVVGLHREKVYGDDVKRIPENVEISRREAMRVGRRRTREEMESNERYVPPKARISHTQAR